MRPPEFTGGNGIFSSATCGNPIASMRPPEFTGGNHDGFQRSSRRTEASMRPPEFTGGNAMSACTRSTCPTRFNEAAGIHRRKRVTRASEAEHKAGFNEAAGIHRRKRHASGQSCRRPHRASMRPPEFTGGNFRWL